MSDKKGLIKEFKEFITTGDLITTAIGLIIALKVAEVINKFMDGVVTPLIGGIFGKQNFDDIGAFHVGNAKWVDASGKEQTGALVKPGVVITSIINLIIVGAVLFGLMKMYKKMRGIKDGAAGPTEVDLLTEIRDSLKNR